MLFFFLSYLHTSKRLNHFRLCVTADASTSGRCPPACQSVYLPRKGGESGVSHKAASGQHPAGQMNCRQPHRRSSRDYLTWHRLCQPLRLCLLVFGWTILTPRFPTRHPSPSCVGFAVRWYFDVFLSGMRNTKDLFSIKIQIWCSS